jgi:transposase
MSTGLLYHAFGVGSYQCQRTEYVKGQVVFSLGQSPAKWRCSVCNSAEVVGRGKTERRFRTLPIGRKSVTLVFAVPRVGCHRCGAVRQVKIGFADPRFSYTHAFERYALELSQHMTIKDVAQHLNVSWDVIKDIQKRDLQRRYARIPLADLRQIAIDEISIGRGHRYLTVVLDLASGAIVFLGEGRGAAALEPFWRRLHRSDAEIDAVAMDMAPAYILAVQTHIPWAVIVFDHFHVIKLFNEKLSALRRELYHQVSRKSEQRLLKGTRWLLLKNPENLDPQRNEGQRLQQALRINQPLATAYYLKEDLRQFWDQPDKATATTFLADWCARAKASGVPMLRRFAKLLDHHEEGLLAYYEYRISTGPLEGTNNKIRTMQRQAYGFRDLDFFKLKIFDLHRTKYALVG